MVHWRAGQIFGMSWHVDCRGAYTLRYSSDFVDVNPIAIGTHVLVQSIRPVQVMSDMHLEARLIWLWLGGAGADMLFNLLGIIGC